MKQITFYDYGIDDILNNRKNATIRSNDENYEVGEVAKLCCQSGYFIGYIRILSKQFISLSEISDELAHVENWKDAESIKNRLCFTYGDSIKNYVRYTFIYLSELTPTSNIIVRGRKISLKHSEGITVISSNAAKLKRLSSAVELACSLPVHILQVSPDETEQLETNAIKCDTEAIALAKARHFANKLGKPILASDDGLIILMESKPVFISEIKMCNGKRLIDNEVVGRILKLLKGFGKELPVIIRTGIAIAISEGDSFATSVIYRRFYFSKLPPTSALSVEEGFPLNKFLTPRPNCSREGADLKNSLMQPFVNGIKEIIEVKDG